MSSMPSNLEAQIRQMHPLTVIGMHRSGTSLMVRLLKDLGIHMGSRLSRDAEAVYFQMINRHIYNTAGSKWAEIQGLMQMMKSESFLKEQTDWVLKKIFPRFSAFGLNKGIEKFFNSTSWESLLQGEPLTWGWKDPRTTLTFPIWLRVFPQSRFLHLIRNGIDVAISVHRRSLKQSKIFWKRIYPLDYSPVTLDFQYCFQLWEKYITYVFENKNIISEGSYKELRYEDLLARPAEVLIDICDFMEYPIQQSRINEVSLQINKSRLDNKANALHYRDIIPALVTNPLMQKLGYGYETSFNERGVRN